MKFPSLFRSTSPMRYDVKPRYYDPVKEEIEERTARIKKEMEEEGLLDAEEIERSSRTYVGGIRGSFAQHRGIKPKSSSMFNSTATIRTLLFFAMIIGAFGYIYLGPVILNYLLYVALIAGGLFYASRFLKRGRKDD